MELQTGKAKTINNIVFEIDQRKFSKTATDDLWDLTGVSTGATEYMKVLLCLNRSGIGSIIQGIKATAQTTALVPTYHYDICPIGFVEIPNNYSGGSLAGFTFVDFLGKID